MKENKYLAIQIVGIIITLFLAIITIVLAVIYNIPKEYVYSILGLSFMVITWIISQSRHAWLTIMLILSNIIISYINSDS